MACLSLGVDPETLWALGESRGYRVQLSWTEGAADGAFDAQFIDPRHVVISHPIKPAAAELSTDWRTLASDPARALLLQQLGSRLRERLLGQLPDYMVPAQFIVLDSLPLNMNGKLDRKALPAPEYVGAADYAAPEGPIETALAAIWSDVLGVERVGRHDNFFELGGDSILSLQIVARAYQAGWKLTSRQMFERQTLALLAGRVEPITEASAADSAHEPMTGVVPLLPMQAHFFEQVIPHRHHWNQSVLLQSREPLEAGRVARALGVILNHHDALRLRYIQDEHGEWQQRYAEPSAEDEVLWVRRASSVEEITTICAEAQQSLSLSDGPLLRAVLIDAADGHARLLLAIHHLVVDGVSWRILLEDLQQAYLQARAPMPARTARFDQWASRFEGYSRNHADEIDYWQRLSGVPTQVPCDNPSGSNTLGDRAEVTLRLDRARTEALLKEVPAAYRTQINDVLLTALARALCAWSGHEQILIDLEGHGREELFDDLDLSRTVGWFTSLYPVALPRGDSPAAALKRVKELLREVPNRGLGYGALKYLGTDDAAAGSSVAPCVVRDVQLSRSVRQQLR